jgi:hypothetical protein
MLEELASTTTQPAAKEDLQQQLALKAAAFDSVSEQNASLLADNQQVCWARLLLTATGSTPPLPRAEAFSFRLLSSLLVLTQLV